MLLYVSMIFCWCHVITKCTSIPPMLEKQKKTYSDIPTFICFTKKLRISDYVKKHPLSLAMVMTLSFFVHGSHELVGFGPGRFCWYWHLGDKPQIERVTKSSADQYNCHWFVYFMPFTTILPGPGSQTPLHHIVLTDFLQPFGIFWGSQLPRWIGLLDLWIFKELLHFENGMFFPKTGSTGFLSGGIIGVGRFTQKRSKKSIDVNSSDAPKVHHN